MESKNLIHELRSTMGKLEVALGTITDCIVWTSEDGAIQWCNGAFDRLVSRPHIAILGAELVALLPLEEQGCPLPHAEHPVRLALASGPVEPHRAYALVGSGRQVLLTVSWTRVRFSSQDTSLVFLIQDVTERQRAAEEVRRAKEALAASYTELEAFSYSVAHDLRTPLRHVDGLSQVLLEDLADKIDDANKDVLLRIRAAAARMEQLIDDLLELSRVGRAQMSRERVNLSQLAESIAGQLQESQAERHASFVVADGLTTLGDARLLRVVLENLMGNAWKFTAPRAHVCIEVGACRGSEGTTAYFVRDNGVGFDMAYSHKLFGVFERLHGAEEFPGTGIGLATTQRIIQRHGGKIWAEGEIGKGATFYFALPERA